MDALDVIGRIRRRGAGIAVPERDAVFGRFYRGAASQGQDGSGLGLAIVREIARMHGGTAALLDTPGGGLTVSVCLALAPPDGTTSSAA